MLGNPIATNVTPADFDRLSPDITGTCKTLEAIDGIHRVDQPEEDLPETGHILLAIASKSHTLNARNPCPAGIDAGSGSGDRA